MQQVYGKEACHVHVFLSGTTDLERAVKILKTMQTNRTDANVEHVRQIICCDCQLTIGITADELNIN